MALATQSLPSAKKGLSDTPVRPKISTHLVLVSPQQAREIMQTEAFPRQRKLRPYHVEFLKQLIVHGHFRQGTIVSFAVLAKQRYLINGQHTLTALGESTGPALWLQIEEIRVDTMTAVTELYKSYDRNLARSWVDFYAADMSLGQYELAPTHLSWLGAAATPLATGFESHRYYTSHVPPWVALLKDPYIRFSLMGDWSEEMLTFAKDCQGPLQVRQLLTRASVLAVALVTYRAQAEVAHRFWPSIACDSGLTAGQPAHTLLRWLREMPTRRMDATAYQRHVAAAWNAAYEDRPLSRLTARTASQPILIAGTPHDGKAIYRYLSAEGKVRHTPERIEVTP